MQPEAGSRVGRSPRRRSAPYAAVRYGVLVQLDVCPAVTTSHIKDYAGYINRFVTLDGKQP